MLPFDLTQDGGPIASSPLESVNGINELEKRNELLKAIESFNAMIAERARALYLADKFLYEHIGTNRKHLLNNYDESGKLAWTILFRARDYLARETKRVMGLRINLQGQWK